MHLCLAVFSTRIFCTSFIAGQPLTFTIGRGQVIKGWDEGIGSMAVGGKRTLIIPPALACAISTFARRRDDHTWSLLTVEKSMQMAGVGLGT
eukprot:SAG31_NODE_863_length_11394_cov_8.226737_5_plen_92_part_00